MLGNNIPRLYHKKDILSSTVEFGIHFEKDLLTATLGAEFHDVIRIPRDDHEFPGSKSEPGAPTGFREEVLEINYSVCFDFSCFTDFNLRLSVIPSSLAV
jgi:hypothetical protein